MRLCRIRCQRSGDDDLGHDQGEGQLRALAVQRGDVVGQRRDRRAVGGDDDLERQVVAPRLPRAAEALGLVFGRADVQREDGLGKRGRVGERVQRGEVEHRDGHDGEAVHLGGAVLCLGRRAEACGARGVAPRALARRRSAAGRGVSASRARSDSARARVGTRATISGTSTTTTQAPSVSLVAAAITTTAPDSVAPSRLVASAPRQPRSRWRHQ